MGLVTKTVKGRRYVYFQCYVGKRKRRDIYLYPEGRENEVKTDNVLRLIQIINKKEEESYSRYEKDREILLPLLTYMFLPKDSKKSIKA
jgi:hypothetical protein